MVFRIRDKSLFWTKSGWKNNWEPKILNMPKAINSPNTQYISCRYDHHSFLRIVQSYRNYSRAIKQYLYGDSTAEQYLLLELRRQFQIPLVCETPVQLIKHGAERRFADQLDRDYELLSHNYHPFQLHVYQLQNRRIRAENEQAEKQEKGEETFQDQHAKILQKELDAEQAKLPAGSKLTLDKISQVFLKVARATRGHTENRGQNGEFNDFLQKRRPFLNPNPSSHSH